MPSQTLSMTIVKKPLMGKSTLNWTDDERKHGNKKLKQKTQILIRKYNEKKQLFSKRTYFERLPFELNLKIMSYLDIDDHKSLALSKISIMKYIFSSDIIYNMSNIDKHIKISYFADKLDLNYKKLTEIRFKKIKVIFKIDYIDDWLIELFNFNKLLSFLGYDSKKNITYNQSPLSIKYKKIVCRYISDDIFYAVQNKFPEWRECVYLGIDYKAHPADFYVTNFYKEKDHIFDDWHYKKYINSIEYELKNVGHFNYWDYFHKYPNYHPEHPNYNE